MYSAPAAKRLGVSDWTLTSPAQRPPPGESEGIDKVVEQQQIFSSGQLAFGSLLSCSMLSR